MIHILKKLYKFTRRLWILQTFDLILKSRNPLQGVTYFTISSIAQLLLSLESTCHWYICSLRFSLKALALLASLRYYHLSPRIGFNRQAGLQNIIFLKVS